jgi:hypothetical protein
MKKTIYSLGALREVLAAANRRYLEFISAIDDPSAGIGRLGKLRQTVHENARSYRGFNLFDEQDEWLLQVIARGEFNIKWVSEQTAARIPAATQQRTGLPAAETPARTRSGSSKPTAATSTT